MSEKEKAGSPQIVEACESMSDENRIRVLGYVEGILAAQQLNETKEEKKDGTP